MEIFIEKNNKKVIKRFEGKAALLLKKLRINPETVIIVRNAELITEEDLLSNSDKIKLMSVISGG